ncbi:hypothetical protein QR680_015209 [Steinernema hermaphroditum]|uniref:Helicase ATP-binding domain-containing protein n=1 Tax=Steinernema hermaphroditum TaxID=289476 RepID=A0AA39M5K7_9BILA|nr:hypothetical protein QR680_015209 [Steinernema hermaphroditum]
MATAVFNYSFPIFSNGRTMSGCNYAPSNTRETIETIPTDDPNENAETSDDIANESSRIPRIMKKSPRGDPKSTRRAPSCLRYPTSPQDGSVKLSSENTSCSTASGGSEKKPKWRWWHMFTGTPKYANQKVRKNYSNVVNENCGRQHTDKIVASDLIIANVQTDQNVSETSRLELIANDGHGAECLNTLVKGLLMRRTKAQIDTETQKPLVELKPRVHTEVEVVFEGLEMRVYQQMFLASQLVATELVSKDLIDDEADEEQKGRRKFNDTSVLARVLWDRVILDEAHQIKNRTWNASRACCRLSAINRWCLTGTPIHNELWDVFSLIRFLRVTPFDEEKLWKECIMTERHGAECLNTLVKGLIMRRTKAQIDTETQKPLVELKPQQFAEVEVVFEGLEMRVYQHIFLASQHQVKQLLINQEDMERDHMIRRQKSNGAAVAVQNPFMFN